jgi:hypothetical protein
MSITPTKSRHGPDPPCRTIQTTLSVVVPALVQVPLRNPGRIMAKTPTAPRATGLLFNDLLCQRRLPLDKEHNLQLFSDPIQMFPMPQQRVAHGALMLLTSDHPQIIKTLISVTPCQNWISRYRKLKIVLGPHVGVVTSYSP